MAPIEITVDEAGSSSSSVQPKEEAPMSIMSTGDSNVEKAVKIEAHVIQRVAEETGTVDAKSTTAVRRAAEDTLGLPAGGGQVDGKRLPGREELEEEHGQKDLEIYAEISKNRRHQELEVARAELRVLKDGRKICASTARMVKDFWLSVDKFVEYRAQEILEEKKRKSLEQHLAFIVEQADKISSMVQEGLAQEKTSKSVSFKQDFDDREFIMNEDESDNESTLSKEEEDQNDVDYELNDAAGENIDDLLAGLPPEYLASLGLSKELLHTKAERPHAIIHTRDDAGENASSVPRAWTAARVPDGRTGLAHHALQEEPQRHSGGRDATGKDHSDHLPPCPFGLCRFHLAPAPHRTSVILNWEMELKKWCPAFKILTYFGSVKERAEKRKGWMEPNAFHIVITSYKAITTDIRLFNMRSWQYMILDEAQNIKNWKSQR